MAAWINLVASVLAVGLWTLCSISEARSLSSIDYNNLPDDAPDPQQVAALDRYLRNLRDYLVDETEGTMESQEEEKRVKPSQFFGMRGKRGDSEAVDDQKQNLVDLVHYFNYLHNKRIGQLGEMNKRQPPSGFHAVRGRRSTKTQIHTFPLM